MKFSFAYISAFLVPSTTKKDRHNHYRPLWQFVSVLFLLIILIREISTIMMVDKISKSTSTSSKCDYVPSKIERYTTDNRKENIATTSKYLDVPRVNAPSNNNNNNTFVVVVDGNRNSSSQNKQNESSPSLESVSESASNLFRLPYSEWLKDIDTNSSVLGCGNWKCAFYSRTSLRNSSHSSNDPDRDRYGYLVSHKIDFDIAERTFALVQELSETFSIKHALLANPFKFDTGETNTSDTHGLVVQPIKFYSKDSILFRCHVKTGNFITKLLKEVNSLRVDSTLVNPKVFQEQLRSDVSKTMEIMRTPKYSKCLTQDFQVVIDAITGSIVHIDMDRCFQSGLETNINTTRCLQELENVTESVIARKTHLYTIDSTAAGYNRQNNTNSTINNKTVRMPLKTQTFINLLIDKIDVARNRGN